MVIKPGKVMFIVQFLVFVYLRTIALKASIKSELACSQDLLSTIPDHFVSFISFPICAKSFFEMKDVLRLCFVMCWFWKRDLVSFLAANVKL